MKSALVLGGCGFIGHHLARRLKQEGYWVRVVDIKNYEYGDWSEFADEWNYFDLRNQSNYQILIHSPELHRPQHFDEIYQLAADMGGAGFVFTGENDADIMHNSAAINLNVLDQLAKMDFKGKIFYSSSACMYPQELQGDVYNPGLREEDAYPGNPDSEYGWEKLFSERLYLAYARNKGIDVRIARFHNIYGPEGTYKGGREKAPAAMCRKVIECKLVKDMYGGVIEIWGTGLQTRSFLYIDDCIDAVRLLMQSDHKEPINIGSEEMVTIDQLAKMAIELSGKSIQIKHIPGPVGVQGRNSNNDKIREVLGWEPKYKLKDGLKKTYDWIKSQL